MTWSKYTLALVGIWLVLLAVLFRPEIHGSDTIGYYSWLRSAVIEHSLNVSDAFKQLGFPEERPLSPTGYMIDEWPVGSAVLWLPFFLVGHAFANLSTAAGHPIATDGYSWPYQASTALGSAVYALIGVYWLYRLCQRFAPQFESMLAPVTAWLASPLVLYMSAQPFVAHANDFFMNVLFFRLWAREEEPTWQSRFGLGLAGGLAAAVRPQNAPLLLWPGVADASGVALRHGERGAFLARGLALVAGAVIGFMPQLIVWRVVFGQWLVSNPYTVARQSFTWSSPHFLDVLFSTNRGLFPWTPMAVLAVLGLFIYLPRYRARWAAFLALNFLIQVYIIGSWSSWSGAISFGQRFLVNCVPAFALGLAALYVAWRPRLTRWSLTLISGAFVGWNLVLLARYGLENVPRGGPVPLAQLWLGQFTFLFGLVRGVIARFHGL